MAGYISEEAERADFEIMMAEVEIMSALIEMDGLDEKDVDNDSRDNHRKSEKNT